MTNGDRLDIPTDRLLMPSEIEERGLTRADLPSVADPEARSHLRVALALAEARGRQGWKARVSKVFRRGC